MVGAGYLGAGFEAQMLFLKIVNREGVGLIMLRTALFASIVTFSLPLLADDQSTFSQGEICKATISAIMFKDPEIISVDSMSGGIARLSYTRPSDDSYWAYRCKLNGNRVIWASHDGRWRTHELDEVITYKVEGEMLSITQDFGDGSSSTDEYAPGQL